MRKIFLGVVNLLLLLMMFIYLSLPAIERVEYSVDESILTHMSYTGLSIIGYLAIIPAFIFVILSLIFKKTMIAFLRDVFILISCVFSLISTIVSIFEADKLYVFIVLFVCITILLIPATINVIKSLTQEKVNG